MSLRRLPDAASVLDAAAGDPYVRNTLPPSARNPRGWQYQTAVAWLGVDAEERIPYLSALGDPADIARLLQRLGREVGGHLPVTLPAATAAQLGAEPRYHWHFLAAERVPDPQRGLDAIVKPAAGDERIAALLSRSSTMPSALPGDPAVNRWITVESGGSLLACVADTSCAPGVGHMGSVAVDHRARGQGLGTALVGWLARDLLRTGCDVVAVGAFAANRQARRLYERVGFTVRHEFFSHAEVGALTRA